MHRIEENDKQEGLTQAWHGLTTIREDLSLASNWLRDWDIQARNVYLGEGDEQIKLPFVQMICSDLPELLIGTPYNPQTFKPITNADFLKLVADSVSGIAHTLVSIGSIRNRGRVFASLEIAGLEAFKAGGREFKTYLNFGNGHDKSSVLWVNTSNVCTVCDNTFSMNLFSVENKDGQGLKHQQRHTKNIAARLPEIAKLVDKAVRIQAEFAKSFSELAAKPCGMSEAQEAFAGFVGSDEATKLSTRSANMVARLVDLFCTGKGNEGANRADLFSAITDYYTHENAGGENKLKQFVSSEFGSGAMKKEEFWLIVRDDDSFKKLCARGRELIANTESEAIA